MALFGGLFNFKESKKESICTAILSYCYGNMLNLSKANPSAFWNTFKDNPTNALRSRLFTSSNLNEWASTPSTAFPTINARAIAINNKPTLLFDFKEVSGVAIVNGKATVIPIFVGMIFSPSLTEPPAIYFLEPNVNPEITMLIAVQHDKTRFNLGENKYMSDEQFINCLHKLTNPNSEDVVQLDDIDYIIIDCFKEYTDLISSLQELKNNELYVVARGFYNTLEILKSEYQSIEHFDNITTSDKKAFLRKLTDYFNRVQDTDAYIAMGVLAVILCLEPMIDFDREVSYRMLSVITPIIQ